ncbi:MAG: hypothetical protein ACYC8T_20495 [Myxococcaceae bacterium]
MRRNAAGLFAGLLVLWALGAGEARAEPRRLEGYGRITAAVGWRLTPNDHFYSRARELGRELAASSPGGPAVCLCFGYAANENVEVGIDLHVSGESLRLEGGAPITSITYGALVGVRLQAPGLLFDELVPYVAAFTGPTLVLVSSEDFPTAETFSAAWAGAAGATLRLGERFGATLEYRFLLARGMVPEVSSVNGGGHQLTLGFTVYFAPEPSPGGQSR